MNLIDKTFHTIAFYNLENLFDTVDDAFTNDNEFLPTSHRKWNNKKYERKLYKIGDVISKIGFEDRKVPPSIIGLAEVENKGVIRDLIDSKSLKEFNYEFIHFDSYDERGIDVALVYNKEVFEVISSETFPVIIVDEQSVRDFTRDVLLVSGKLDGKDIHIIVNHWPSRHEGDEISEPKRKIAAQVNVDIVQKLRLIHHDPNIVVLGDFNDNPNGESVKFLLDSTGLYNTFSKLWDAEKGSLNHDFKWNLFDQILVSSNFLNSDKEGWNFVRSYIFDEKFLTQYHGRYKGHPYRTYVGKRYKGGFSDHFPVYMYLSHHEGN